MFSKKMPNEIGGGVPSDVHAREKLVCYVYEYLLHMGAKSAAASFLQEIHWDKTVTLGDPPGFLHSWWCVFWDLYCAAPERRDSCIFSTEAKAFHDYGFVNSGYAVNGLHGPNPVASPLGMPPPGPDGMPPGPAGMGPPPPGFFASPVPGPNMRPSPPQQPGSQPSPHIMMNQPLFMNASRYPGPNPRLGAGVRLGQEPPPPPFVSGAPGQPMFSDQLRTGAPPPHLMPPQRMPPIGSHPMRPMGPNGFPGLRPNMGPVMGMPPVSQQHLQRSWSVSSGAAIGVSNGPNAGAPGTPIIPSPQSLPDGNPAERFGMMQAGGVAPMGQFAICSESSGVSVGEMMMNGDGLDIKHSPASMHGRLNGGTPGPAGPNSVPPTALGEHCGLEYGAGPMHPFPGAAQFRGDQEAEIQKIKDSICEESKRFESGKDAEADGGYFLH